MAPSFLSKLVKASPNPNSGRTSTDARPSSRNPSPVRQVQRSQTSAIPSPNPSVPSLASSNSHLDVNVVPPSPSDAGSAVRLPDTDASPLVGNARPKSGAPSDRPRSVSLVISPGNPSSPLGSPEGLPIDSAGLSPLKTPTPGNPGRTPVQTPDKRSLKNSNSKGELRSMDDMDVTPRSPAFSGSSAHGHGRYATTDANQPLVQSPRGSLSTSTEDDTGYSGAPSVHGSSVLGAMSPIVESPSVQDKFFNIPNTGQSTTATTSTNAAGSNALLSAPDNSDAVSVYSVTTGKKKRPWRRNTSRDPPPALPLGSTGNPPSPRDKRKRDRKPTGLAAALAASGMAMANPGAGANVTGSVSPPRRSTSMSETGRRTRRSESLSSQINSAGLNPGGSHSANAATNRHSVARAHQPRGSLDVPRSRPASVSSRSDLDSMDGTEDSESDDELDLDLDADIPVTGFAVASNKRNADFHELFADVPEGDYLIEDYGCALARDILVQGRLYISENHLCFHANIFGWITDVVIPVYDIMSIEKKMTALIIPNAIQVTTQDNKYTFASFMSRDTTFDVIHNVWRLGRPNSALTSADDLRRTATEELRTPGSANGPASAGPRTAGGGAGPAAAAARKATQCACGKAGQHYSATAMETTYPGTPEKIYNLMFASGFIKDFMRDDQKLQDIQISDWAPMSETKLLSRNMSYIKPLNGSIGPKETKCELKDETAHFDVEDYVSTVTTTRTPNVPSGTVFSVKTRTCITWASAVSAKVLVTTQIEWTGRSFIKGIIERSALDGQMTYHKDLDKAMRAYIHAHPSEFIPEGVDADAIEAASDEPKAEASTAGTNSGTSSSAADAQAKREREGRQRSLQWAWDTFEGAMGVAKRSAEGALDLLSDAWDGSSATTVLYFIIAFLVISNIWTLTMMGRREETGRRKALKQADERERWVHGMMETLLEERAKAWGHPSQSLASSSPALPPNPSWKEEVAEIHKALDSVQARVDGLRKGLKELE